MSRIRSFHILLLLALTACISAAPQAAAVTPVPTHTAASQLAPTSDACTGATEPGARERFTFNQIIPCLDTIEKVRAFTANNIKYDPQYDNRERGGNEYVLPGMVYQRGIDDGDGHAILQCYLLEMHNLDAFVLGLSIDSPTGSNVCGVNLDGGIQVLEGGGDLSPLFPSMKELAAYYTKMGWMHPGGVIRSLKASQVTGVATDVTDPSVSELPWQIVSY